MNIDRHGNHNREDVALQRIKFVLDQFEMKDFDADERYLIFDQDVIPNCKVEELVGALVSAEQVIKGLIENDYQFNH